MFFLFESIYLFGTLTLVERKVASLDISTGNETRLTLRAFDDKNVYYQIYEGKFNDPRLNEIEEGSVASFYTTLEKILIHTINKMVNWLNLKWRV